MEPVASEPIISDPIDMEIDENGSMYVVGMHGYPLDNSGVDRVIILKDRNKNVLMNQRTIFVDSLVLPIGSMRWKEGMLVTDPPSVIYGERHCR